jgi:hypothetical protein
MANYACIFGENELDVYEGMVGVDVEEPSAAVNDVGRVRSLLDLREFDEQLHSQIYGVCEVMEEGMDLDERREVLSRLMGHIWEIICTRRHHS